MNQRETPASARRLKTDDILARLAREAPTIAGIATAILVFIFQKRAFRATSAIIRAPSFCSCGCSG